MAKRGDLTLRIRIEGRVQGVGFRAFVASLACDQEVVGEVWNTRDGSVEAILQHREQARLDKVVAALERGPGRVDRVSRLEIETLDELHDFVIGHTR